MAISYSHYVPNFKCKSSNWESPGASQNLLIEPTGVPIEGVPHFQVNILQVGALATVQNFALLWPPVASTRKHDPSVSKNPHPLRWGFHSTCLKPLKPKKISKPNNIHRVRVSLQLLGNLSNQDSKSQQHPLSWSFLLSSVWNLSNQNFKTQQHPLSWGFPLKPIFLSLSANPPMFPRKFCSVANVHQCTQKNQTKN